MEDRDDEEEVTQGMDEWVRNALECPCVKELKVGPCGGNFQQAFTCFAKSKEPDKGSDCVQAFQSLQLCISNHPEAFEDMIQQVIEEDSEKGHRDEENDAA
mmetsp:Transcript_4620/g.16452  ORF Transcript_4620/g.16452 Transcript_4620/m.16452 type:complete len:101 (+) Transcript_4620:774-1076(+)